MTNFEVSMKGLLNKSENWLLIIPLLCTLISLIIKGDGAVDIHFYDTYFIIGYTSFVFLVLLILCLPFAMHKILRSYNARNGFVGDSHVLLTVLLLIVFYLAINRPHLQMAKNIDASLIYFIVLTQVVYSIYAIIILIGRSIKYRGTSVRRNDAE